MRGGAQAVAIICVWLSSALAVSQVRGVWSGWLSWVSPGGLRRRHAVKQAG